MITSSTSINPLSVTSESDCIASVTSSEGVSVIGRSITLPFAYFHERRSLNNFHRDRVITFEQIAE
ncbi:hypothetical protein FRN79_24640 [Escherichia coli]|nr:hypothetical protein [Escherichia coli]